MKFWIIYALALLVFSVIMYFVDKKHPATPEQYRQDQTKIFAFCIVGSLILFALGLIRWTITQVF